MDKTIVPSYKDLMMPLLQSAADGKEHSVKETTRSIAKKLNLSKDTLSVLRTKGKQALYYCNLCWAKRALEKEALIKKTGRGLFRITGKGQDMFRQQ